MKIIFYPKVSGKIAAKRYREILTQRLDLGDYIEDISQVRFASDDNDLIERRWSTRWFDNTWLWMIYKLMKRPRGKIVDVHILSRECS